MFPWLISASVLCLIAPNNNVVSTLGSGYRGAGILNFSFDWNAIGQVGPLVTPWWAQVNGYFGMILVAWTSVIDPITGALNVTAYENYSSVYSTSMLATCYGFNFMQIPATISHVILFHGKEIWNRYKKTREEEETEIHCKMMDVYPEVPHYWYGSIFFIMLVIAITLGYTTGANLPWWCVLLAVAIPVLIVLPIGIIQATSNMQIGLNIIAELICGFLLPGYPIANVYFKTYGTVVLSQCHYMKIPPRSMFISQIWGTVVGVVVNYWTLNIIINAKRPYIDGTEVDPTGQWAGFNTKMFDTASIMGIDWTGKDFRPGSIYSILLWGFLIGGFLPIPFYLLHLKFPKAKFNLVNMPLIILCLSSFAASYSNFLITGFIASFISQFYLLRYKKEWWMKYNYIMSAAFDSGAQIMAIVSFICLSGIVRVQFPIWWGNDPTTQSEHCFSVDGSN
ncbi:1666_t:CDS:10 [Cetraspora pellucida]|uniref:1666_t:CDS:1 n=1 Tax=Cetraspora pellucida TaxID=1433469 RepID=A0A9N9AXK0_9GLOM|nr:1666_t:CDS:10 [Cetraspora pellucida]